MMVDVYDVIVVGAGVEGSSTAYNLARAGYKTLLLEQFALPHTRGSSHGPTRIIRKAYDKSVYANMMNEAYQMWEAIAKETQTNLYKKTGLLYVGSNTDHGPVAHTEEALMRLQSVFRSLTAEQLRRDYPTLSYSDQYRAVFDRDAGVLFADKCLAALRVLFRKYGGKLHDAEPVTSIVPGEIVTINTTKARYKGCRVVLTVGPWSAQILRSLGLDLPLTAVKISVCYWAEKQRGAYGSEIGFPAMIHERDDDDFYLIPSLEYPGLVKVCSHYGPGINPDKRDGQADAERNIIQGNCEFVKRHFPMMESEPSVVESCIYTMTPDSDFILDVHPTWRNIVIGAGFSGHGFKMAPVIGKLLSEMATERMTSYDIHAFRMNRFFPKTDAKAKL